MGCVYMIIPSFKHRREGLIILLMLWNILAISQKAEHERVPVGTHRCAINLIGKYWIFPLLHQTSLLYQVACIYCFVKWQLLPMLTVFLAYYTGFCIRKKKSFLTLTAMSFIPWSMRFIFACYATAAAGHKLRVVSTALAWAFLLLWRKQR